LDSTPHYTNLKETARCRQLPALCVAYFFTLKMDDMFLWGIRQGSACSLLLAGFWLAYSSTLKMEAICSSGMLNFFRTSQCYNPEEHVLHSHVSENHKSKVL
jgi:hypothetical protein